MNEVASPSRPPSRRSLVLRWLGIFFIGLALLALYYGLIGYFAWRSGEQVRLNEIAQTQQAEMSKQWGLAQGDVTAGRYVLAARRLDWILARDGQYLSAAALRAEVDTLLARQLTPSPTPTLTPTPDGRAGKNDVLAAEQLADIERLMDAGDWEVAVEAITDFQIQFPSYQRQETTQMLYDAYIVIGQNLLARDQVELGLSYLYQAQQLGDLSELVAGQVTFAELYLEGIVFYGVNWPAYLYYFRELCTYAPLFHDSCALLHEGLVAYGDQLATTQEWCPAAEHYREAQRTQPNTADDLLINKRQQAEEACLLATPTPSVITGTLPMTDTTLTSP